MMKTIILFLSLSIAMLVSSNMVSANENLDDSEEDKGTAVERFREGVSKTGAEIWTAMDGTLKGASEGVKKLRDGVKGNQASTLNAFERKAEELFEPENPAE